MRKQSKPAEERGSDPRHEKVIAMIRRMMGDQQGREDDEHPLPPGPWDPVIRIALERIHVFGPHPDPWRVFGPSPQPWQVLGPGPQPWRVIGPMFGPVPDPWRVFDPDPHPWRFLFASLAAKYPAIWEVIGGGPNFGAEVALNPQPLPPRFAFFASLAKTVLGRAELLQEFAEATRREGEQQGIIIVGGYIGRFVDDFCGNDFKLRWPFPGPRPHWLPREINGVDLLVMAAQFDRAAKETWNQDLGQQLADASAKLAEAGLSKAA